MAGIVAALEADHDVSLLGQPIDDFPLAFVSPLGADHDNVGHEPSFPVTARKKRLSTEIGLTIRLSRDNRCRPARQDGVTRWTSFFPPGGRPSRRLAPYPV